jgi:hypothetical protein
LADETRKPIYRGEGYESVEAFIRSQARNSVTLSHWLTQDYYLEIWYEARSMTGQFQYYTDKINLRPMGGQGSIPCKWQAAMDLEDAYSIYDKEIIILYFGDLDYHGKQIIQTVEWDLMDWCSAPFEVVWCGLTMEQVEHYNVPGDPDKGGYQWVALPDEGARDIIKSAVNRYTRHDGKQEVKYMEATAKVWWKEKIVGLVEEWKKESE